MQETDAKNLFNLSFSYFLAMDRLLQGDKIPDDVSAPFYFLTGFALELSLKSILLAKGGYVNI